MPGDVSHLAPTVRALFKEEQLIPAETTRLLLSLFHDNQKGRFYIDTKEYVTANLWSDPSGLCFNHYMSQVDYRVHRPDSSDFAFMFTVNTQRTSGSTQQQGVKIDIISRESQLWNNQ